MRFDAKVLVMRRAWTIGRKGGTVRVSVAHRAYSLAAALDFARSESLRDGQFWIEMAGQPARLKAAR